MKSMRLGGGGKFDKLKRLLMGKGYTEDQADAIAAQQGRKKYGKEKFQKMAAIGLRRSLRGGK